MSLPPTAPGYTGGVLTVNARRCWVNREYRAAGTAGQCLAVVSETDDLGLCPEHIEELKGD